MVRWMWPCGRSCSISAVIANIYMEALEEIAQGPQFLMPTPWWKRYVVNIISIVKKEKVGTLYIHLNSVDLCIKFTMEAPGNDGSISFLDTKCSSKSSHTIHTSVYRKPTNTDHYLNCSSNYPVSAKTVVIHVLIYRAKNICSTPEILAKMDYFHRVYVWKIEWRTQLSCH